MREIHMPQIFQNLVVYTYTHTHTHTHTAWWNCEGRSIRAGTVFWPLFNSKPVFCSRFIQATGKPPSKAIYKLLSGISLICKRERISLVCRAGEVKRNEEGCGEGTSSWRKLDPTALWVRPASAILPLGIPDLPWCWNWAYLKCSLSYSACISTHIKYLYFLFFYISITLLCLKALKMNYFDTFSMSLDWLVKSFSFIQVSLWLIFNT